MKTTVELLIEQINILTGLNISMDETIIEQAIKIENNKKLKNELFVGKVSEIIGFSNTIELLRQCNEPFEL